MPGGVGYYGAFKYTLERGSLSPADGEPDKQVFEVVLAYENLSNKTVAADIPESGVKLDGDQSQQATGVSADPSGDVAPGTKGIYTAKFDVGSSFEPSKVAIVLGDPNSVEAPFIPLGSAAKRETRQARDERVDATLAGINGGATLTLDKATLQYTYPDRNSQAAVGTVFVALHGVFKGATEDAVFYDYEFKLREPDGSVVPGTASFENGKRSGSIDLATGQTKDATILFVVNNNKKVVGAYEVQLPNKGGKGTVNASLMLS